MEENIIQTRVVSKHDCEYNWMNSNFIPKKGELVIYDSEVNADGNIIEGINLPEGRETPYAFERIKVGDGFNKVSDLKFDSPVTHGDTPDSFVSGQGCVTGCRGFIIVDVVPRGYKAETSNTIELTLNSVDGLSTGDICSMRLNNNFVDFAKINSVDEVNNKVLLDSYPEALTESLFERIELNSTSSQFWVGRKQSIGTHIFESCQTAEGYATKALGYASHAEGRGSVAAARWSHAEGSNTYAGYAAHAEGQNTTASGDISHAEGSETTSSGVDSHAEGWKTLASGKMSHAEGKSSIASGEYSHAEADGTKALGEASHAEGYNTKANGSRSHAEGDSTVTGVENSTVGKGAHAEGRYSVAKGESAHAEGFKTYANAPHSHTEGFQTIAYASMTHAEGYETSTGQEDGNTSESAGAHAEGYQTNATGKGSHAGGTNSQASGEATFAHGYNADASYIRSYALGSGVKTSSSNQTVLGAYNKETDGVVVAGVGTSDSSRKNGYVLDNEGNLYVCGEIYLNSGSDCSEKSYGIYNILNNGIVARAAYADRADLCGRAESAGEADSATNATNATHAESADYATQANQAAFATDAGVASRAISADTAKNVEHAENATYADTANYANSAGGAAEASTASSVREYTVDPGLPANRLVVFNSNDCYDNPEGVYKQEYIEYDSSQGGFVSRGYFPLLLDTRGCIIYSDSENNTKCTSVLSDVYLLDKTKFVESTMLYTDPPVEPSEPEEPSEPTDSFKGACLSDILKENYATKTYVEQLIIGAITDTYTVTVEEA